MGNCCVKKPGQKIQPENKKSSSKQNSSDNPKSKVPQQSKKTRVKETVKLVKSMDADGNKILNQYMLQETLGRGSFGKVRKVLKTNDNNKVFAMKILKKTALKRKREFFVDSNGKRQVKSALDDVRREIAIMKKIHHENLIQLYEVIESEEGEKLFMVIDFAEEGQLIDWDDEEQKWVFLKDGDEKSKTNETFLKQVLRDSLCGLKYLHEHGIIHRDIKPQNLLFGKNGKVMLADFGVSAIVKDNDTLTNTEGTYYFMAPEVLDKNQGSKGYSGKSADIWSLGITLYCFAYQKQPFLAEDQYEFMEKLQSEEITFPEEPKYSDEFKDLLRSMLKKTPEQRTTIDLIGENEWINQGHSQKLSEQMKVNKLEEVNEQDLLMALQISTVARIKTWVQKWKSERKLSQNSRVSGSISQPKDQLNTQENGGMGYSNSQFLNPNNSVMIQQTQENKNITIANE